MKFRPCIDIHNGKVKQIVGGSISDTGNYARENFVSTMNGSDYANLYKEKGLKGGHVILLNKAGTEYYEADLEQARGALQAYPGGLQIGGGIHAENAAMFLEMGASHVIVTSYVFDEGVIHEDRLRKLVNAVGKEHIVLDLSCREKENQYYIVTNRWQKYTKEPLTLELLKSLASYCDEFLVHSVDVEGTGKGINEELVRLLAQMEDVPVTYAGGIGTMGDVEKLQELGENRVDFTIGSALDLFGGTLPFDRIVTEFL